MSCQDWVMSCKVGEKEAELGQCPPKSKGVTY